MCTAPLPGNGLTARQVGRSRTHPDFGKLRARPQDQNLWTPSTQILGRSLHRSSLGQGRCQAKEGLGPTWQARPISITCRTYPVQITTPSRVKPRFLFSPKLNSKEGVHLYMSTSFHCFDEASVPNENAPGIVSRIELHLCVCVSSTTL